MSTGKKTITATTAILETGLVMPNQMLEMGARATMGAALTAMAMGSIARDTLA